MRCGCSILSAMSVVNQLDLFTDHPSSSSLPSEPSLDASVRPATNLNAPLRAAPQPMTPTPRPPTLPDGARWREVVTPAQSIGYVLRRSRRKSIGLVINDDGLQVTAPGWVPLGQVDAAVIEKHKWIVNKLRVRQARQQQLATADTQWQHGGQVPYLGQRIVLMLDGTRKAPEFDGQLYMPSENDILNLALPADADRERVRDSVHAWLQQRARIWFGQRLEYFLQANQLGIRRWRLSSAATRWGSCSSDGNIMLNWRLIHFDHGIIDYVIAHEIAHLREMNHSKAFWQELGRILPGFEQARDRLRQHDPGSLPLL